MNNLLRIGRSGSVIAAMFVSALLAACGSGDQGRDPILGVDAAVLTSVTVTPALASVPVGLTQQYVATATYSDNSTRDVTATSAWASATPASATVNASTGLASAVAVGTSSISATWGGKSGSATLTVLPAALVSMTVTPPNPNLNVGITQQFGATGVYTDGSIRDIGTLTTFTTGTATVASINSTGLATAVAGGTSVITGTSGTITATTNLTVNAIPVVALSSIVVSPGNMTLGLGSTQALNATAVYSDGSRANVTSTATFTSSSGATVGILTGGSVSALALGTSTITATSGGKSGSAIVTVAATAPAIASVNLRTASTFGVLAGGSIVNNAGGTTLVTGDVGSPTQTVDPAQAAGFTNYKSGTVLTTALADMQLAITDINSRSCTFNSAAGIDLGGLTFGPGVYCFAGAINMTGTFTMNGPGLYVFRTASTLNTAANSIVVLSGGATAANVNWLPVGATTIAANSTFKGNIASLAPVTLGNGATMVNGRILTNAAATLNNNLITR